MAIEKEIFKEFFEELKKDDKFPKKVRKDLKSLHDGNKFNSEDIIKTIKEGDLIANEN